ncbi:hypothetical protein, partial [Hyphomonas sp.]|uniref:hypothetical protein n=1 Tax=Hyphomonas sp. TaxID=87 RepID=UPI003299EB2A
KNTLLICYIYKIPNYKNTQTDIRPIIDLITHPIFQPRAETIVFDRSFPQSHQLCCEQQQTQQGWHLLWLVISWFIPRLYAATITQV